MSSSDTPEGGRRTDEAAPPISSSSPRSLGSNATWNLFATLWSTFVALFLTPFMIGKIGTDHYGLYILLMSVIGFLGVMHFGLDEATLRYVAHYYGRRDLEGINRVFGSTFSIYGVATVAISTVTFTFAPDIIRLLALPPQELQFGTQLVRLTAVNFSLLSVAAMVGAIPQALQRYDISSKLKIGQSLFQVAGTVVILLQGGDILALIIWNTVCSFLSILINAIVAKRLIPDIRFFTGFSAAGVREVFGYGVFSMLSAVLYRIWAHSDRLLLGSLVGVSAVAHFTVPRNLSFRFISAAHSAGSVLFPRFSTLRDEKEQVRLFLDSTWVLASATVTCFVPMIVLLPDFLRLWIDPAFAAESAWVGQVVAVSCLVRGGYIPYDFLFRGLGFPQYVTFFYFCSGTTSLAANILLIPRFGLAGAGYSYLVTQVWDFVAIAFAWRKVLHQRSWKPLFRVIVLPGLLGGGLAVAFSLLRRALPAPGWMVFFTAAILIALVSCLTVLGAEHLVGGKDSRVRTLIQFLRRQKPPGGRENPEGRDGENAP